MILFIPVFNPFVYIDRYNLKGTKKGQTEVFIDGLPGYPDNIHSDKKGEFHVTLPLDVDQGNIGVSALLGPYPLVRKFLARMLYLLELPAHQINLYYPNYYTQVYTHWVSCLNYCYNQFLHKHWFLIFLVLFFIMLLQGEF